MTLKTLLSALALLWGGVLMVLALKALVPQPAVELQPREVKNECHDCRTEGCDSYPDYCG